MFFTNVFSYSDREKVCQHAYRTTRRDLRLRMEELGPVLKKHGISVRPGILDDPERHFSQALETSGGLQDIGRYMNRTTNVLSAALDRLDGWMTEARKATTTGRRAG
jgi:hypothetical protein